LGSVDVLMPMLARQWEANVKIMEIRIFDLISPY